MDKRWQATLPWIAPALLCLIAIVQFGFAHLASLSPWKGGGFGMFSTVDSPGARFLRIRLLTAEGEIPVQVPDDWRERVRELRTTGSQALAEELAEALARGAWVKLRVASAVQYYRHLLQRSAIPDLQQEFTTELRLNAPSRTDEHELDFVRMLRNDESPGPSDTVLAVSGVRVELWKYTFDRTTTMLVANRTFDVRRNAER